MFCLCKQRTIFGLDRDPNNKIIFKTALKSFQYVSCQTVCDIKLLSLLISPFANANTTSVAPSLTLLFALKKTTYTTLPTWWYSTFNDSIQFESGDNSSIWSDVQLKSKNHYLIGGLRHYCSSVGVITVKKKSP